MEAVINRAALCGYLKKIFVNEGERGLKRYKAYLDKEYSKKRNTLQRNLELNDQIITFNWWTQNVKGFINPVAIKNKQSERARAKEQKLLDYLFQEVLSGRMTFEDIKSPIYREMVQERWDQELPF